MNLKELHLENKSVSSNVVFKQDGTSVVSLNILKGARLEKHLTKVPAFLVCICGSVIYQDEQGDSVALSRGEFFQIKAMVNHWIDAVEDSQLLLVK